MVLGGTKVSHKFLGAKGSQISYNVLHIKEKGGNINSHLHGQYDSPVILKIGNSVGVDEKSTQTRDSSEWKLNSTILIKLCQIRETPEIDLFPSRVSQKLPYYMSWKIGSFSQGRDALDTSGRTSLRMLFTHLYTWEGVFRG